MHDLVREGELTVPTVIAEVPEAGNRVPTRTAVNYGGAE